MATRERDRGAAAVITNWRIDPAHTIVEFSTKHMMITRVKGRFREVEGTLELDESNPENSAIEVRINAASIDTGVKERDDHLRSPDFLDAGSHPHLTFRSKRVEGAHREPGDEFEVEGDLTIRDVTRSVTLQCVFHGTAPDPWGGERASFSARSEIDRRIFGLEWNQKLEKGGVLVGHEVRIEIEAQLVREP